MGRGAHQVQPVGDDYDELKANVSRALEVSDIVPGERGLLRRV